MGILLLIFFLLYILPCMLVGFGARLKFSAGFWLYFFVSFFLTPIVGLIILLLDKSRGYPYSSKKNDDDDFWTGIIAAGGGGQ